MNGCAGRPVDRPAVQTGLPISRRGKLGTFGAWTQRVRKSAMTRDVPCAMGTRVDDSLARHPADEPAVHRATLHRTPHTASSMGTASASFGICPPNMSAITPSALKNFALQTVYCPNGPAFDSPQRISRCHAGPIRAARLATSPASAFSEKLAQAQGEPETDAAN